MIKGKSIDRARCSVVSWLFAHPRTPVLVFAVTPFPVGSDSDKTNRGLLPPTRNQSLLGLVVVVYGSGAQLRKNWL